MQLSVLTADMYNKSFFLTNSMILQTKDSIQSLKSDMKGKHIRPLYMAFV